MPTKGKDVIVKEKRGRSPLLPRKVEIGQQTRSLIPPTLDRKHALASTETKKIPIYDKPTVCSTLYALNTIKHTYVDNTKLVPQSRVMSIRSMFNEKKVTNSYIHNTKGSPITKDARKPHIIHGKKLTRQPNIIVDKTPKLFKDDHNIVTHVEDDKTIAVVNDSVVIFEKCNEQCMHHEDDDISTCEAPLCEPSVSTCDEIISIDQHTDDDQENETNGQDQPDKLSDHGYDGHQSRFEVDQENQEPEDEQRVQEVEHDQMEPEELGPEGPEPKEPDIKEGGEEVPKEEDRMVKDLEVVIHGKKDTAAYDYVMEVSLSELQQQRLNKVKALVGAFENVISLECHTFQKSIKQH